VSELREECNVSEIRKVIRDGKVAVLYSPGFGAGWSSWGGNRQCLFAPEIVALVERGAGPDAIADEALRLFGDGFYTGGASGLTIEWIEQGRQFRIDEYDGSESIVYCGEDSWVTA
jgi:hypothetical protein